MNATTLASTPGPSMTPGQSEEAAFARATERLLHIGAVPVPLYLQEPALLAVSQNAFAAPPQPTPAPAPAPDSAITRAVARLHQACQQTFGNTEALKYDFEEDTAAFGKRCRLTITRPNGASRTYVSPSAHTRKYDAKAHVSTVAIESGALDFIISGEGKGTPEAEPTPPPPKPEVESATEMDESVKSIEQTCLDWTYGRIKPFWLLINEPKFGRTQGCALRIRLGPRNSRVYSVNTIYSTAAEAKKACAEVALADNVLDYIKSWSSSGTDMAVDEPGSDYPNSAIGLQQFFDSLPQPFPEPVAGKTALDINGPAWLNTTIQSARGGKIVPNFVWTVDTRLGYHGCLLRLERPGEVKSYLVDARFSKRAEAKAAVCLLAMSEGVGEYIRSVAKSVEDKLPPALRKHAAEVLTPLLNGEYRKAHGPGIQPQVEYDMDLDACGATMIVELCPTPTPQQVRKYTVPAEYRNRNDAKLAVVAHAVEQGVIEFLRFKGRPTPPGYVPYYAQQQDSHQFMNRKRKNWEGGGGEWGAGPSDGAWNNKKPRIGGGYNNNNQGMQGGGGGFVPQGNQNPRPAWNGQKKYPNNNGSWSRPNAPGPGQFGNGGGPAHVGGHFQPGPRNVGVGVPHAAPAVPAPYPAVGGGPQQPPAAYGYPVGGFQPAQAPFYGAAQPQAPYPAVPMQAPQYAAPNAMYAGYYAQPQPPVASAPAPVAYPQQYQYGAPYPGQGQVPGYPSYSAAPVQYTMPTAQPGYYPATGTPAPAPAPVPHAPGAPVYNPGVPGIPPIHNQAVAGAHARPPAPYPPQPPAQSTPPVVALAPPVVRPPTVVPTPPVTQPPPPPPPSSLPPPPPQPAPPPTVPPPPPPPTTLPPPPPPPSATPPNNPPSGKHLAPSTAKPSAPALNGKHNKGGKPSIAVEPPLKTSVAALYDFCQSSGKPTPEFHNKLLEGKDGGEPQHKVWVVIGKMKFELPITFPSLSQGQEKVAKKVLNQLRQSQASTDKAAKP